MFSRAIAPFYIPTNSAQEFQLLHILTCTCSFFFFFVIVAILMCVRTVEFFEYWRQAYLIICFKQLLLVQFL